MNSQAPTITAQQQTLRALTLAMAGACNADLTVLSTLLNCASQGASLAPEAAAMLRELAEGVGALASRPTLDRVTT